MKTICLMIPLLLTGLNLAAQQDYKVDDLGKLSVEHAEHLLKNAQRVQIRRDMPSAAIRSGRMDLIEMCFQNIDTGHEFVKAAAQIQDQDFRDQIVLMMLKNESPFWGSDSGQLVGGLASLNILQEPFIATIKRNFPDLSLNNDLIATEAARAKLARKLEVVIDRKSGAMPPPEAERPTKRQTPQADPLTNVREQSKKPPSPNPKLHERSALQLPETTKLIVWTAGTVSGIGFLWLVLRKRKS